MDYSLIEARPGNTAVLLPDTPHFTVLSVSNDYVAALGIHKDKLLGGDFFSNFPESTNSFGGTFEANVLASLNHVIQYKQSNLVAKQRFDIRNSNGDLVEKYWKVCNVPVLSELGEVRFIIHTLDDITEQVKSVQKADLYKDVEKAYGLFMQAPVATCIVTGPQHIVELANEHMLQFLGRTSAMVGKPIEESLPEAKMQGLIAILDHIRKTGESYHAPNFSAVLLIDGVREQRYFDLVFQPYYKSSTDAAPTSIFCVAYNVTKQIQTQKQLEAVQRETERQKRLYEAITGSTPDLLYVFDLNYRFTYANDALLAMWGKDFKEAIGKSLLENGYEPWHAEMHEREIDRVVATKQAIRGEVSFPHSTLGSRVYDYIFVPVINEEGEVEAVAGTTRDITEIKEAERSIRESEERFRYLADESPMFVFIVDANSQASISYWNKTWLEYTGQTIEEANGIAWEQVIHPEDLATVSEIYGHAYQNRQSYFIPAIRVKRYDDVYRWHAFKGSPRYLKNNVFNGYVGVGLDIHDQKLAEEALKQSEVRLQQKVAERTAELQKAIEELKRLNANLEQFAYAASHDLKEPIRKINVFADRIKAEFENKLSGRQSDLFGKLENSAKRMSKLIDDLLAYSQATNGVSYLEEVDLNKNVQLVLEDLELEVQQKQATITVAPLPTIVANKRQTQQLFQNLISNALKYNKAGTNPDIHISSKKIRGREVKAGLLPEDDNKLFYLIEVKDNGIGFSQEDAARIFNVFTRLHENTQYKGTGVGLSIAQKVVENHHGKIWAESKRGEGSTFKVLLPVE